MKKIKGKPETQSESTVQGPTEVQDEITEKQQAILAELLKSGSAAFEVGDSELARYYVEVFNLAERKWRTRGAGTNTGSIRFTLEAIASLPGKQFTPDDVLAAVKRLYPESTITRAQMSSLLWKLLSRRGSTSFRQVVPWTGGNKPAVYEKTA